MNSNTRAAFGSVSLTRGEIDVIFSSALVTAKGQHNGTSRQRVFGAGPSSRGTSLSFTQFVLALDMMAQRYFARLVEDQQICKDEALGVFAMQFLAPFTREHVDSVDG